MPVPTPARETKKVKITVTPKVGITADPDQFCISKSNEDQVEWVPATPATTFKVHFDESPFGRRDFDNVSSRSGKIRDDVEPDPNKVYKYTVKSGSETLDPTGIINP